MKLSSGLILAAFAFATSAYARPPPACGGTFCACNPTAPQCINPAMAREAAPEPVLTPVSPICRKGDCSCDLTSPQCKKTARAAAPEPVITPAKKEPVKICLPEDCRCNSKQPSCTPPATI